MNPTFLDHIIQDLHEKYGTDISQMCLVVPTRRAIAFLRESLAKRYSQTMWAPKMVSIQDLIREHVPWQFPDQMTLIFELYHVYAEALKKVDPQWFEPLERFYSWGEMLLKDFDEVDKYCVDAESLFSNVKDLKEIEIRFSLPEENLQALHDFWFTLRGKETDSPTDIQDKFLQIWSVLHEVYLAFKEKLLSQNMAYDGMAFRHIAEKLEVDVSIFPYERTLFIGFNALTKAEERMIQALLSEKKGAVYWDVDKSYFAKDRKERVLGDEAGKFIREYHLRWKGYGSHAIFHDMLATEKKVHLTGVPLLMGQAQYLANITQDLPEEEKALRKYAIVLADEELLFPVLFSLPPHIQQLNVTMGFPLRQTHLYHLILSINRLLRNMELRKGECFFSYKDILAIIDNPFIKGRSEGQGNMLKKDIRKSNRIFLSRSEMSRKDFSPILKQVFSAPGSVEGMSTYFEKLFDILLEETEKAEARLEAEYIYQLYILFNQFRDILHTYQAELTIGGYIKLFQEVIQKARIPFEGEPLSGLQVMGFLETRVLDFENLYILAANEGNLPDTSSGNSFIPFNLRKGFGMPTYEEKDAIYAYHFYRLLQRAKEVHLIYNSLVKDVGGSGELSRFIRQIRYFLKDQKHFHIQESQVNTPTPFAQRHPIHIPHSSKIQEILKAYFDEDSPTLPGKSKKFLSATALTTYLNCRLRFYFKYIARIQEPEQVEETMEANTFGSVLHAIMENVYKDHVSRPTKTQLISQEVLQRLQKKLPDHVKKAFLDYNLGWDESLRGKNVLFKDVIQQLCKGILTQDEKSEAFEIRYLEEEQKFLRTLEMDGVKWRINGAFDRVDYLPHKNIVRIIDYKTGRVNLKKHVDLAECFQDAKQKEIFQGFLYAWMYHHHDPVSSIQMGYYTVRNLKEGISYLMEGQPIPSQLLQEYEKHLKELIHTIYTEDFDQVKDEKVCRTCPYNEICNRV